MDKNILNDYIDACALVQETERDIRALKKKRKTIIQTNVSGSNPDSADHPVEIPRRADLGGGGCEDGEEGNGG